MRYDVVALGELLIDFAEQGHGVDQYPIMAAHPGGAPANCLAALTACGKKTALLGKVGQDMFGDMLVHTLCQSGIDSSGVVQDPSVFTTMAFVRFGPGGEREFSFARKPGADASLTRDEVDLVKIENTRVFHFGTLSLCQEPSRAATRLAVEYAKEKNKLITFDPNYRAPLWSDDHQARSQILWGLNQADVVKISDDEVEFLYECAPEKGAARILQECGNQKLVLITMGAKGCWYQTPYAKGFVPAFRVKSIDTTGAGDIFGGTVISGLIDQPQKPWELHEKVIEQIVRYASAVAGISTMHSGGISSVPSTTRVLEFLASQ